MTQRIAGVAIMTNGALYQMPAPKRHYDVMRAMCELGEDAAALAGEQGFVDQDGKFLTRAEARIIAEAGGQLKPTAVCSEELFSEDVW